MTFDLSPLKDSVALGILQPIYKAKLGTFIDYDEIVQRALGALHADVLLPFLVTLKRHLELIQVCLGEVDCWLLDSEINTRFLETTFGKTLEASLSNQPCMHCCAHFVMHQRAFYGEHDRQLCQGGWDFYNYHRREEILMEYENPGRFEVVFYISQVTEQTRLIRLLDFMSI